MYDFTSLLRSRGLHPGSWLRWISALLITSSLLLPTAALAAPASQVSGCQLNSAKGNIQHVIYIIFDNTHFLRDNPNVPSDLEQMPHLLNFMRDNGTLLTNDHTVLISHTANGILTSFTGVYPDRHGQAVTNSYRYFKADGTTASSTSFKYWTDLVDDVGTPPADPLPNMVNGDSGTPKTTPAPWVPYTRAGCDFGAVASANIVLENTGTGPGGDITKVFGANSAEWNEAVASNAAPSGTKERALPRRTSWDLRFTALPEAASVPVTPMRRTTSFRMSQMVMMDSKGCLGRSMSTQPFAQSLRLTVPTLQ